MSAGLKALLDAAQYIEHQENLKRSPQAVSIDAQSCYIEECSTTFDINVTNGPNNNNNINTRNSRNNAAIVQQVSSSAPASSATFQHISNGVIITNNSGTSAIAQHRRHHNSVGQDCEYRNGNIGMTVMPSKDSPKLSPSTSLLSLQANISSLMANGRVADDCISTSQLQLHNGDSSDMIVEDGRSVQCVGNDHSPLRQNVTGSQYFQMLSSQHISGGSQSVHLTPVISTTGRRRTISSNSNGAGTREVHNKLEKNRRAHLKECYEQLKNELPLKDDERKKTSNLAILGEALKYVKNLKKKDQELEAEVEQLAKTKINSQRKLVSLKRELGFPVPLPDFDLSSSEREHTNETGSLSSGRGSILYSSSSSLSSGGSSGSTTMSSPVSASIQTAMPTAISPVISRINSTNAVATNFNGHNSSLTVMTPKTPTSKSPNVLETLQQQIKTSTSTQANNSCSTGTLLTTSVATGNVPVANVNSTALSLTTNNISVMSLTRESPTPSTPSPSPSGSSCVSSSSSIISTSPPRSMNGVINGRSVTVSIPNNLRFTSGGIGASVTATTNIGTTNGNGMPTVAGNIIAATSQPNSGNVTNTNNAKMLQALRGCHLV